MTSRWSNLEGAPVVAQTAFALGKILREQLGIGEQQFDVVAHSLGSALAVAMSNARLFLGRLGPQPSLTFFL